MAAELMSTGKKATALRLKQTYGTEEGKILLKDVLDELFGTKSAFDDEKAEWCTWIAAGGELPDNFISRLKSYQSSTTCGIVWGSNFIAYRCRTCGISPCMSICAQCFNNGDHEGHDFNMFRSQAGGACDCGDINVLKEQGFCKHHSVGNFNKMQSEEINSDVQMFNSLLPRLFNCIFVSLNSLPDGWFRIPSGLTIEPAILLLSRWCETDALRELTAKFVTNNTFADGIASSSPTSNEAHAQSNVTFNIVEVEDNIVISHASLDSISPRYLFKDEYSSQTGMLKIDYSTKDTTKQLHLEWLMMALVNYSFPDSLTTLLLRLLPNKDYKLMFAKLFCKLYTRIGCLSMVSPTPHQLCQSSIHASVQIFSNEILAFEMVRDEHLLDSMFSVYLFMVEATLRVSGFSNRLETDQFQEVKKVMLVADCSNSILKKNRYWSTVTDLSNIISHQSVLKYFIENESLVDLCLRIVCFMSGMNESRRRVAVHVPLDVDPTVTGFAVEIEGSISIMWLIYNYCKNSCNKKDTILILSKASVWLMQWLNESADFIPKNIITFHYPLHRWFALFISLAVSEYQCQLKDLLPNPEALIKASIYQIRTMVGLAEIRSNLWGMNGYQTLSEAKSYTMRHFCTSLFDLDVFLIQLSLCISDPDEFLSLLLDSFGISQWFGFTMESPGVTDIDPEQRLSMVEEFLHFLLILLSSRAYTGVSQETLLRKEIVGELCVTNRTHSWLLETIPKKPLTSSCHNELVDILLSEVADFAAPSFEQENMQQGMYAPKDLAWKDEYDYIQVRLRSSSPSERQSSHERYIAYLKKVGHGSAASSCWPPLRDLQPIHPHFNGILRLLGSDMLLKIIYSVLYKASCGNSDITEAILIPTVHLLTLMVKQNESVDVIKKETEGLMHMPMVDNLLKYKLATSAVLCLDFLSCKPNQKELSAVYCDRSVPNFSDSELSSPESFLVTEGFLLSVSLIKIVDILDHIVFNLLYRELFSMFVEIFEDDLSIELRGFLLTERHITWIGKGLRMVYPMFISLLEKLCNHWARFALKNGVLVELHAVELHPKRNRLRHILNLLVCHRNEIFKRVLHPSGLPSSLCDISIKGNNIFDKVCYVAIDEKFTDVLHKMVCCSWRTSTREADISDNNRTLNHREMIAIEKLISIFNCSHDVALFYLIKSSFDLDIAVTMYLDSINSTMEETHSKSRINHNLIGILAELRLNMVVDSRHKDNQYARYSDPKQQAGDGVFYIDKLLQQIALANEACKYVVKQCCPDSLRLKSDPEDQIHGNSSQPGGSGSSSNSKSIWRKKAQEMQRKVMMEFSDKQKLFLGQTISNAVSQNQPTPEDAILRKEYDCVICGETSLSSSNQPIGLVVMMQASAVLSHRQEQPLTSTLPVTTANDVSQTNLGTQIKSHREILEKSFTGVDTTLASSFGLDSGIHLQSCGHHLHIKCHESYASSLLRNQMLELEMPSFDVQLGEFPCPICRQLSNAVLPVLPIRSSIADIPTPKDNDSLTSIHSISQLLHQYSDEKNIGPIAKKSFQFNMLTASCSTFLQSVIELEQKKGEGVDLNEHQFTGSLSNPKATMVMLLRNNIELGVVDCKLNGTSKSYQSYLGELLATFHFHAQTSDQYLFPMWQQLIASQLTNERDVPLLCCDVCSLLLHFVLSWPEWITIEDSDKKLTDLFLNNVFQSLIAPSVERNTYQKIQNMFCLIVQLIYNLLVVQISLLTSQPDAWLTGEEITNQWIQTLFQPSQQHNSNRDGCLQFLQFAAFIQYGLFNTPLPDSIGDMFSCAQCLRLKQNHQHSDTFPLYRQWVNWPEGSNQVSQIAAWCYSFNNVIKSRTSELHAKDILPISLSWCSPSLLPLPERYDGLFQFYSLCACSQCLSLPTHPAVCLVCGCVLCLKSTCWRRVLKHSWSCGHGTGVFLAVSSSFVLVVRRRRVCVWGSLYLDAFGEEDQDLRRGKPLFLSMARFERLQSQWLTHTFERSCKFSLLRYNSLV